MQALDNNWLRLEYYRELERRQRRLGRRYRSLRETADGISMEYLFDEVAELAGCRAKTFHGYANTFTHRFDAAQRRVLVDALFTIIRQGGAKKRRSLALSRAAAGRPLPGEEEIERWEEHTDS
jgi:hypothetical protein